MFIGNRVYSWGPVAKKLELISSSKIFCFLKFSFIFTIKNKNMMLLCSQKEQAKYGSAFCAASFYLWNLLHTQKTAHQLHEIVFFSLQGSGPNHSNSHEPKFVVSSSKECLINT